MYLSIFNYQPLLLVGLCLQFSRSDCIAFHLHQSHTPWAPCSMPLASGPKLDWSPQFAVDTDQKQLRSAQRNRECETTSGNIEFIKNIAMIIPFQQNMYHLYVLLWCIIPFYTRFFYYFFFTSLPRAVFGCTFGLRLGVAFLKVRTRSGRSVVFCETPMF